MATSAAVFDRVVPAKTGVAVEVRKGQRLRVTDLEGKQVVDMCVFNRANPHEKLSTSWSRTRRKPKPGEGWRSATRLVVGDVLLSTLCRPMLTIVAETAEPKGVHDTYVRMCNTVLYEMHGLGPKKGCFETVSEVIKPYGVAPEDIPDPFNTFMNMEWSCEEDRWVVKEPVTKAGDYIEYRAEMDLLVALSNCPEDQLGATNAYHCTPTRIQVFET